MIMGLFGFNPKSFEQFIQAISLQIIGPGLVVFGSGPDGGREGTFDGEIPYPFDTDRWNGFGIVQAKCKEKTEGTQIDQEWALAQLESELKALSNSDLGRAHRGEPPLTGSQKPVKRTR